MLRALGVALLLMLGGGIVGSANAQVVGDPNVTPATKADVYNLSAELSANQAVLQNLTAALTALANIANQQATTQGTVNVNLTTALATLTVGVQAMLQTVQSENVQLGLLASGVSTTLTNISAQVVSLRQQQIASDGASYHAMRMLEANLTGDNVKFFRATYVTDNSSQYFNQPAYLAVLDAQAKLGQNQVISHNDTTGQAAQLAIAINKAVQSAHDDHVESVRQQQAIDNTLGHVFYMALAVLLLLVAFAVYMWGPQIKARAFGYRGARDRVPDAPMPDPMSGDPNRISEQELAVFVEDAKQRRVHVSEEPPAPTARSRPRYAVRGGQ